MLIDQQNGDVLPSLGKAVKGLLNSCILGFSVDNEKVYLSIGRLGDVLWSSCQIHRLWFGDWLQCLVHTPMPASSRPVTESYLQIKSSLGLRTLPEQTTSSPITARKCRSLYAEGGAAMFGRIVVAATLILRYSEADAEVEAQLVAAAPGYKDPKAEGLQLQRLTVNPQYREN